MKKALNFNFVSKNPYFKKIILFDKKKILFILFLSIISTIILTLFPVITQFYIVHIYQKANMSLLFYATTFFLILYLIKIFIDIKVEKYRVKYFGKIEKSIKEKIFEKYNKNLKYFLKEKGDLSSKHLYLYVLLIRTFYYNIIDGMRIIIAAIIIFLFDKNLFLYFVYAIPFFILFYLIHKKIILSSENQEFPSKSFEFLIGDLVEKGLSHEQARKIVMNNLENDFRRKTHNKTRFTSLNTTMNSFIPFFRIFYLAYFGYYMLTTGTVIVKLIVSLLYITILINPIIRILKSLNVYHICTTSFYKINSLYKK